MKQTEFKEQKVWINEEQRKHRRIAIALFLLAILSLVVFVVFQVFVGRIQ
jgi:predicted nucleic acid-binding Zn ribbon protein